MTDEMKAWSSWLSRAMRRRAVARLPEKFRTRYDEEWESATDETPGEILKLVYSVGLLMAAVNIRRAALKGSSGALAHPFSFFFKRVFDTVFSALTLILLAPLVLAIALAVKLESRGPVFYTSERIGKKGVVFRAIKFRTMVCDADARRTEIVHMNDGDDVALKVPNGPRVTLTGRFLRKYSLDELPQYINVLRGEMSIVGPRPPLVGEVRKYDLNQLRRLDVTPGITGLWQVRRHEDTTTVGDDSLDVAYIDKWSIWLDFKIILRTIRVVFEGTGLNLGQNAGRSDGQDPKP